MNNKHPTAKILLVDDDERNLIALEGILNTLDATFVKVNSGKEALKALLDQEFALILLDVKMPILDGLETASIIRMREKNKEIPIIFVTAYHPTEANIFQGYALGAVDYIVKPIIPEILLSKVQVFIQLFEQQSNLKILNEQLTESNISLQTEIKERIEAQEKLQLLTNELKRSNQDLEQFAYMASHDLQQPLMAIMGYAQLLIRRYQGKFDEKADHYFENINQSVHRMQALIKDLLTYSRVGRSELDLQPTNCNSIVKIVLQELEEAIAQTSGKITTESLPTIMADKIQITQLFSNLIGNALKYHSQETPQINITAIGQDQEWLFGIRDNGIGIEDQYTERVFLAFQRLHSSEEYPGTGIGLALCKKIVERHHGRIWLDSELGKGSTFYFTIPK